MKEVLSMETERLIIRNFKCSDAKKCFTNFGQDESLGLYLPMFPMKEISEMNRLVSAFEENPYIWLIEEKISYEPVGYISVDIPYDVLAIGEIGYVLGEKYQHKGYATEAVNAMISHLFLEQKLYIIEAKYNENNIASSRLLNKLGFKTDGMLRERRIDRITGQRCNLVVCSITKDEWN